MTGFGQAESVFADYKVNVELKSVNHRFLDIGLRLPRHMLFLEDGIRRKLQSALSRGHIDVFVRCENMGQSQIGVNVDYALLAAYQKAYLDIRDKIDIYDDVTLSHMVKLPDVVQLTEVDVDQQQMEQAVQTTLQSAIAGLIQARAVEGEAIQKDLLARVKTIRTYVKTITKKASGVVDEYRVKLSVRLETLVKEQDLDVARFNTEVALFADKSNIDEEITRLNAHIAQFIKDCDDKEPVGRRLDFLLQEMNRETTTIGSKSADINISRAVIDIKCELEKIREQIQNVE